jgi:hypothetical protein
VVVAVRTALEVAEVGGALGLGIDLASELLRLGPGSLLLDGDDLSSPRDSRKAVSDFRVFLGVLMGNLLVSDPDRRR